ncbi:MAG: hypothetical protein R3C99_06735 [Pirellulaceae bacterium]
MLGNNVPALPNNAIKGLTVQEAEPNDTIFQGNTVGIGTGTGQDSSASITGTIQTVADYDYYKVYLKPGDIISILVTGGANDIALLDPMGRELQGSQIDVRRR